MPRERRRTLRAIAVTAVAMFAIVAIRYYAIANRTPSVSTDSLSDNKSPAVEEDWTAEKSLDALLRNERPIRLLRLVVYDPASESQLSVAHLTSLGRPQQKYTFVGDYDEVAGETVAAAIHKLGGSCGPGQHVSAIVFPSKERSLYLASARGLLEVINKIEPEIIKEHDSSKFVPANVEKHLSPAAWTALQNSSQEAGTWESYWKFFRDYSGAVAALRSEKCTVFEYIGNIDRDWQPLGYSQAIGQQAQGPDLSIDLGQDTLPVPKFGARVFLVANVSLADLSGQCLLDFDKPHRQVLPDLKHSLAKP